MRIEERLKLILDDINNQIINYPLFQKNNKNFLIKYLTFYCEKKAVQIDPNLAESISNIKNREEAFEVANFILNYFDFNIDRIGRFHRATLKFIEMANINGNIKMNDAELKDKMDIFFDEYWNIYMNIRNHIMQGINGKMEFSYDVDDRLLREESKMSNRTIKDRKEKRLDITDSGLTFGINQNVHASCELYLKAVMNKTEYNNFLNTEYQKTEIPSDFQFEKFTGDEVIKYSAMMSCIFTAIMFYNMKLIQAKKEPVISLSKDFYYELIVSITGLSLDKVIELTKYQIYDFENHKNNVSLFQHLYEINDEFVFSSVAAYFADISNKMLRIILKKIPQTTISLLARRRESEMIKNVKKIFADYKVITNIKFSSSEDAEYDVVVYDSKTGTLLLCECKWYFLTDDEFESKRTENKICESIQKRKLKDKIVKENIANFMKQAFNDEFLVVNTVKSFMISYNDLSDVKPDKEYPVIDYLRLNSIQFNNLNELFEIISNEKYIEDNYTSEMNVIEKYGYVFEKYENY